MRNPATPRPMPAYGMTNTLYARKTWLAAAGRHTRTYIVAAGAVALALVAGASPAAQAPAGMAATAPKPAAQLQWAASRRLAAMDGLLLADDSHSASTHWQSLQVNSGDTLSALFARAHLPAADWRALLRLGADIKTILSQLQPGDTLHYQRGADGHLSALTFGFAPQQTLHVKQSDGTFHYSVSKKQTTSRIVRVSGTIRRSLLAAARRAGVDYAIASRLGHIFHWRIDLSRSIQPGDHFVLVYRQVYAQGQLLHSGPILAAELTSGERRLTAFRYSDSRGNTAYYDAAGKTLRPSLMRTPVRYTRVSSHFSRNRMNPVLHVRRPHYGVDLAAPTGTPIHAAASGQVKFVGRNGGYGRLVILTNFGPYSTRYGHMSRFAKGLDKGDFVKQGQVIGYVGQSGVATGPHLHFEIRINGKPKPPLKVDLPGGAPIAASQKTAYKQAIRPFLTALNAAPANGHMLLARQPASASTGDTLTVAAINKRLATALFDADAPAIGARKHG